MIRGNIFKVISTLRSHLDSHPRVEEESTWIQGPTIKEPKKYKHETCSMTCGDTRRRRWWVHPVIGGSVDPPMEGPKVDKLSTDISITPSTTLGPHVNGRVDRPPYWSAQGRFHPTNLVHAWHLEAILIIHLWRFQEAVYPRAKKRHHAD